jgi:hypothetical protein
MQKNVSGQKIGAQMVSATDGSAFTGSVTVSVTGDAGTQATGSVGSGACTHEGNGYHTYAPAQAETNYDLVAFTFVGTGAVPTTVQVFTRFNANLTHVAGTTQTAGDIVALINTVDDYLDTEIAALIAFLDTEIAAILADTNELQVDWANGGRLDLLLDTTISQTTAAAIRAAVGLSSANLDTQLASLASTLSTIAGYLDTEVAAILAAVDTEIAAILADTNELQTDWTDGGRLDLLLDTVVSAVAASAIRAAVGLGSANLDTQLSGISSAVTASSIRTALGLASANLDTQLSAIAGYLDTELAAVLAAVDTEIAAILVDTGTDIPATLAAMFTTQLTESYRAAGAAPTAAQALFEIIAHLGDSSISGTTKTLRNLSGTAAKTFTLDSATTPTSITETT